ncbi:MAG: AAA family ATPase [Armatimonadota bacterium]|nr:AAA family ATPase [Armatimonadota bacterium]MDR7571155.1 AAA family ATPase [Armatimonadota bacterium]MDR7614613.1 AAA family ATPase [Armatimonadota bacterium]
MQRLEPAHLRRTVDPTTLGIESTDQVLPLEGIVGQPRAVESLRFGLQMRDRGFNVYVAGLPGLGKMTAVRAFLEETARRQPTPPDWCYVNNFTDPYQPRVVQLPPGRGREFQQDMRALIARVRREIPKAFESEEYGTRRDEIIKGLERQRSEIFEQLQQRAAQAGFTLQPTPIGILVIPVLGGRPISDAELQALPAPAREELQRRRETLQEEVKAALKQVRVLERAAEERLRTLDRQVALHVVGGLIEDLMEKYASCPEITEHLQAVQQDIVENLEFFKGPSEAPAPAVGGMLPPIPLPVPWSRELFLRRYEVNLLVDNSHQQGAPVVVELNPSYTNLFGKVEKETQFGALYTDFTMIKPGALHRANGGYLVIPVEDLLRNAVSWDGLKRALRSEQVEIEDLVERLGLVTTKTLRPQPVPLRVKVVLVGHPLWYYLLYALDEEFAELFKIRADFDVQMPYDEEHVRSVLAFICKLCQEEKLRALDSGAAAKILEHSLRLADDQEKLSARFGALSDVIREANFWAERDGADRVTADHVRKALESRVYRSNLIEERIRELIARGILLVDTDGEAVGQVNGLSVIQLGDYAFGRPSRITASVAPGREGIIDIERQVRLGGPIHSKGVLILSGYVSQRYAQDKPLTLSARLVFEQSYEMVEGDSASAAELFALLSALSGVPIRQGIAVTGSVNQHGQIQAVGGVNQKIEGFYDVCRVKGLTGRQGVIIPASNVKNLMLREDVVEAVREGKFHIWAIETVDEGLEILTGLPAGERGPDGRFPEGTVNARVDQRLREFAERVREAPAPSRPEERPSGEAPREGEDERPKPGRGQRR